MEIVAYRSEYKKYFIEFNTDWILDYFGNVEDEDRDTFDRVENIIADGGMVYFAVRDDVVRVAM